MCWAVKLAEYGSQSMVAHVSNHACTGKIAEKGLYYSSPADHDSTECVQFDF